MKVLIIDTTRANMVVGLINNEEKEFAIQTEKGKHNETLLPLVDKLLSKFNLTLKQLDAVAVNIGAGSFTGIRVGVSTVKAFCSAIKTLKCVQFNTLELLAYSSSEATNYTAVISAGASNLYVANCCNKSVVNQFHNTIEEFKKDTHSKIVGLEEEKEILPIQCNNYIKELKYFELVENKFNACEFVDSVNIEPLYLRLSQAERELQQKNDNNNK